MKLPNVLLRHFYIRNLWNIGNIKTWKGNEQAAISQILNGFETNLSRIASSHSVISPLLEPTAQMTK